MLFRSCRGDLPAAAGPWRGGDTQPLLCTGCHRSLVADVPRCAVCGERQAASGACPHCRRSSHGCAGMVVLGGYSDHLRAAVLRCKRPAGEPLADTLAALVLTRHARTLRGWRVDAVVPVPMHWRRRMLRGTSAADTVAAGIAARMGLPWRPLVRRSVATRMQNELPACDRPANVASAFLASRRAAGQRLLLVDDVCTTGATLAACRAALEAAGAEAVYAAVVAKADRCQDHEDE